MTAQPFVLVFGPVACQTRNPRNFDVIDKMSRTPPGLVSRSIAYLIDCCCAFLLFVVTQVVLFGPLRSVFGIDLEWFRSGTNTQLYTIITISLPVCLYFALTECSKWRATVGKRIMKLQVIQSVTESRISLRRSVLRTIIKLLPWELAHVGNNLPTPIWYVEEPQFRIAVVFSGVLLATYVVVLLVNPSKKCIHDLVTATKVVSSR